MNKEYLNILKNISKPSRYLDFEFNAVKKKWSRDIIKVALVFPDTYEIGQSGLGLKILYHILNSQSDILAERFYAPWLDFKVQLKLKSIPLLSLESFKPLGDFDLVGFSLQHELTFTNILSILDSSGIPFKSINRGGKPLIFAGGPSCYNPEPVADFFDFFAIGDGEEIILEIVNLYKQLRSSSKEEIIKELSKTEGIYVPSYYNISYKEDGRIKEVLPEHGVPRKVIKRVVRDLSKAVFPTKFIVPYIETIHDRVSLEIFRGCTRGCRFCQAGIIYRPVRERSFKNLLNMADEALASTGYDEISFTSLSSTDYLNINKLIKYIASRHEKVNISLPSLRIDEFTEEVAENLGRFRKSGLTFAPEAGSQRLRNYINKNVDEDKILKALEVAKIYGWRKIKFYFMIGLPTETYQDLEEIVNLIRKCLKAAGLSLSISISSFVPKCWTPFQWESQDNLEVFKDKISYLKKRLRYHKLKVSFHDPQMSILEGVFSRGDRKLSGVIEAAYKEGALFDSWKELFDFNKWRRAFDLCGIDYKFYNERKINPQDLLPWDHICPGIGKEFLISEKENAGCEKLTFDCRYSRCSECGVCDGLGCGNLLDKSEILTLEAADKEKEINISIKKLRFKYRRKSPLEFLSHLEILRTFQRAVRRAGLSPSYTEGFHPRMKIVFAYPLGVGIISDQEFVDMEFKDALSPWQILEAINSQLPGGIELVDVKEVKESFGKLTGMLRLARYKVRLTEFISASFKKQVNDFLNSKSCIIEKKLKKVNLLDYVGKITFDEKNEKDMSLEIKISDSGSVKPEVVLSVFNVNKENVEFIKRTALFAEYKGKLENPIEII